MDELTAVGVYASAQEGFERCLVILAMGVPCWLEPVGEGHSLIVETSHAEAAAEQLRKFELENVGWPPPPPPPSPPASRSLFVTPLLWVLVVSGVFALQNRYPERLERIGALDGDQLYHHGQWWRPVTALFLHAGASHWLSNAVAGLFVFAGVVAAWGVKRGWLLLAAAGIGGNLLVGALYTAGRDVSLGASTAIFGAVGLLAGRAVRAAVEHQSSRSWKTALLPLAAGLTVLGLYGAGGDGVEVDVAAHAAGFICGLGLGLVVRAVPRRPAIS